MMSKKFCYRLFPAGLTCRYKIKDECCAGFFCQCKYKSTIKPTKLHNIIEKSYKHLSFERDMYYIRKGELPPIQID